jgi:putative FmdB family regulatory protein
LTGAVRAGTLLRMPIFDYQCRACENRFEQLVRSDTKVACPSCGGSKVTKLLSVPAPAGGGGKRTDFSALGPPKSGGCCGGGCGGHSH